MGDHTDSGEICFHGFGKATHERTPYLRVDTGKDEAGGVTLLEFVWRQLIEKWEIAPPKMLVSVTEGTEYFINTRLKNSIKHGLVNIATNSGAWITTGGTGTGVMQFVGEAVRDHQLTAAGTDEQQVVVLGIATWGNLTRKEDGVPSRYSLNDLKDLQYQEHTDPLDPNHTHFLLIDDGKEKWFRDALESYISKQPTEISHTLGGHVPVILLVLEGGVNTLETVHQALEKHTPVVIIQGSGRAADFISLAYKEIHGWDETNLTLNENVQRLRAATMFEWKEGEKTEGVEKVVATLQKILSQQNRPRITVFDMDEVDTTNEVDNAIFFALLKALSDPPKYFLERQHNAKQQLKMALAWNRCDIAQQQIFDIKNRNNWQTLDLTKFMRIALRDDRVEFVQLFMDNEVNLKKFLTKEKLEILYSEMQSKGKLLCFQHTRPIPGILYTVGEYIKTFLGGHNKSLYMEDEKNELDIPEHHLFFWAILVNRQHLAKLFWRAGKDPIGGALVASSMLRSLGEMAKIAELELSQDLLKSAEHWEKVAVGVLTECYNGDKERSQDLLNREIPTWGDSTLFEIAYSAEQMDFMNHTCCQTKLSNIWRGKMGRRTPRWKIILCMFLPFFLRLIHFPPDKPNSKPRKKKFESASMNSSRGKLRPGENDVNPQSAWLSTEDLGQDQNDVDTPAHFSLLSAFNNYHAAPITKFGYHMLSSVALTGLFSYFVLTDLAPVTHNRKPSYIEYVVWGWAATIFLEELRQVAAQDPKALISKLKCYFESAWNQFDFVMQLALVVSIALRYSLDEDSFVWARMMYSLVVIMYFLRLTNFFFADKKVGPKIIMIRHMLIDVSFFILLTVMLAYGVAIQALLFPNSPPNLQLLKDVLYKPYWHIYGEVFLDQLEGDVDNCSDDERVWGNGTYGISRCPQKNILVLLILVVYMIITNILLVNLLIAMFSHTFTHVQQNSEKVWCYYFYGLVYEYLHTPILMPPFIIITHIYRIVSHGLNPCRACNNRKCCNHNKKTDLKKTLGRAENLNLTMFEKEGMEKYLLKQRVGESKDNMAKASYRDHTEEETLLTLQHRMAGLEKQMCSQTRSLETQAKLLELLAMPKKTQHMTWL